MKKFLLQIALFFALVALVDVVAGLGFSYLERNAKGGFTYRDQYICNQLETDILVSGSSRCVHHYNPRIISDSLGLSCYNSGQMGNGIILNYGRFRMIAERKKPKMVIYDVQPEFDLFVGDDNHRYLTWLKGHYDRDGIAEIFESVDKTEKFKMRSRMYRYNSRLVELLADYLHPISNAREDDFRPSKGNLNPRKIKRGGQLTHHRHVDPVKLGYIGKLVEESEGCRLVFVVSPIWYGMDGRQLAPLKAICDGHGIPFLDFSNDPKYVHHDEFFKDGTHMNSTGADEFTKDLVAVLKQYMDKQGCISKATDGHDAGSD